MLCWFHESEGHQHEIYGVSLAIAYQGRWRPFGGILAFGVSITLWVALIRWELCGFVCFSTGGVGGPSDAFGDLVDPKRPKRPSERPSGRGPLVLVLPETPGPLACTTFHL